jgi:hypothetical protein
MITVNTPSKRKLIIFLLWLIPLLLSGQPSYRNGFIILDGNSVKSGYVRPVSTEGSVTSCFFRIGNQGPVEYRPGEIAGFSIEAGKKYASGELFSVETSGKFLEVLFDGVADLVYYTDQFGEHYFISDLNDRIFSISVDKSKKGTTENNDITELTAIRAVIRAALADVPSLAKQINSIVPGRQSLVALLRDYHFLVQGSGSGIEYQLPPPLLLISPGIFAGYSSDLFMSENSGDQAFYSYDPSFYPSLGVLLKSPIPRISWNFYGALSFSLAKRYTYGFYSQEFTNPEGTVFHELHMHNLLLKSELLFGYSFGRGKIKPSLFAGPVAEYLMVNDSRIDYDTVIDWLIMSDSKPFEPENSLRAGFSAGASVTYELNKAFSPYMKASYSRLSGDSAFRGVKSFNVSTGLVF